MTTSPSHFSRSAKSERCGRRFGKPNPPLTNAVLFAQGFSEQALKDFAETLKPTTISAPPPYYVVGEGPNVTPDVWFNPTLVWEIKAADLSISPVHRAAAGLVDATKGIALRFPRLLRVRDDKKPEDATTATQVRLHGARAIPTQQPDSACVEQVAEFYRNQKINHGHAHTAVDEADEE